MGYLDEESLFSLEIVADRLRLAKKITCRYPAIAFRLLDFPTLIIYHIEPAVGEAIKRKLKTDSYTHIPEQLSELQDREGQFQVKKGKSCLFKVPPNLLLSHLQNTPLYVMVLDTYPHVPKLVGNCTVALDKTMAAVFNDIQKFGISVPASRGEKGEHKIFNLMGEEIGQISFGFRIISLGVGLISHIPDRSIAKMGKNQVSLPSQAFVQKQPVQKTMKQEATDIILEDLETADQNIQVVLSAPQPSQSLMGTQTEMDITKIATTQTEMKKKVKKKQAKLNKYDTLETMAQETIVNELFITNTICPPVMFYNSNADPPQIAPGLTFDDYMARKQKEVECTDSDSSVDSDSTIRDEDRFSESEYEIQPKIKPLMHAEVPKQKKFVNKTVSKPADILGGLAHFPLLSALMSEIVALQGSADSTQQQMRVVSSPRSILPSRKVQRIASPTQTVPSKTIVAMNQEAFIDGRSHGSPGRKYSITSKASTKNKGFLTEDAQKKNKINASMTEKKTKLAPGMTNTQRLRLAKTNPQLLEKMEKEEIERVEKFKARRRELGEGFEMSPFNISTEIKKHPSGETSLTKSQYNSFARQVPGLDLYPSQKRPVPTPRLSLKDEHIVVRELPPITPRASKKPLPQEAFYQQENNGSHSSRSHIDVHVPSISIGQNDDGLSDITAYSDNDEVHDLPKQSQVSFGKTFNHPGFPKETTQSSENISAQYSDDFEDQNSFEDIKVSEIAGDYDEETNGGIDAGEVLGLRRMADQYSDESDNDYDISVSDEGHDPREQLGLRRMVDTYSDDEKNESSRNTSRSYHSAHSHSVHASEKPKLKLTTSLVKTVAPPSSAMSPMVATKQPPMHLRNPMEASSSTQEDTNESVDSTAYIRRSEIGSQYSSVESTGPGAYDFRSTLRTGNMSSHKPHPSPRKSLERIRTESVSSYAPSEGGPQDSPLSPVTPLSVPVDDYSDNFESAESGSEMQQLPPDQRFGYTWQASKM